MILPEGAKEYQKVENPKNYNEKLVKAFATAYKWQKMLRNTEVSSFAEIAKIEKTEESYVRKIFKLNYVAPDIVDTILKGNQPANLNLQDFTKKLFLICGRSKGRFLGFDTEL